MAKNTQSKMSIKLTACKCHIYLTIDGKDFILTPDEAAEMVFKIEGSLSSFNTWEYLNTK